MKTQLGGLLAAGLVSVGAWANPPAVSPNLSGNIYVPPWASPGATSLAFSKQNPDPAVGMDEKQMAATKTTPPSAPMPAYDLQSLPD
jgi:hypothetical protein